MDKLGVFKKIVDAVTGSKKRLVLSIYSEKQKKTARVNPVSGKYWRVFQPVELETIELKWNGGF